MHWIAVTWLAIEIYVHQVYALKWSVSVHCLCSGRIKFWRSCKMAHFKSLNSKTFQNITNHTVFRMKKIEINNDKAIRIQLIFLPCHCITQIIYGVTAIAPLVTQYATQHRLWLNRSNKRKSKWNTFRLAWTERKRETLGASRHAVFFFLRFFPVFPLVFPQALTYIAASPLNGCLLPKQMLRCVVSNLGHFQVHSTVAENSE